MKKNKYLQIIQAEIDLHGLTRMEVKVEVEKFLKEAEEKNYNKVRIITGKGLHSENAGVLKQSVQEILNRKGYQSQNAKINEGGSGALDVLL